MGETEEGVRADAMRAGGNPGPVRVGGRHPAPGHGAPGLGGSESGPVPDRVYVSSSALHVLEFGLEPGGEFRHSATNKTVFAADVMYWVLEGEAVLADPQHGEVRVVPAGDQVLFRRDTWRRLNPSPTPLRVWIFAPPPAGARPRSTPGTRGCPSRCTTATRAVRDGGRRPATTPRYDASRACPRPTPSGASPRTRRPTWWPARRHRAPHRHHRPGVRRPRGGPPQGRGRVRSSSPRASCGWTCRSRTATATPPSAFTPARMTQAPPRCACSRARASPRPTSWGPAARSLPTGLPSQRLPAGPRRSGPRAPATATSTGGVAVEQAPEQLGDQQRRPGARRPEPSAEHDNIRVRQVHNLRQRVGTARAAESTMSAATGSCPAAARPIALPAIEPGPVSCW